MERRVLITGGSGLIGRALSANMAADGYGVVVVSRNPERVTGLPANVRVERWDGRTTEGWGTLVNGAYAVVNLAGEGIANGRWTAERKQRIRDSRLNAGQAVVEAVELAMERPRVLLQASGVGFYGNLLEGSASESRHAGQDSLARLAVEWEASTRRVEAMGVRRVVLRTGVVLSRNGGALPRIMLPFRFFVGGPVGSGRQWMSWIHIEDEVGAIRFLVENEKAKGAFNLSAPKPVTNADFSRSLGRQLGRPAIVPTPEFLLRLVYGEMADVLLHGQRVLPRRLTHMGYGFRFSEIDAALEDILS
ncbi:MAG: TIGR01777 family oxidoreductase [Dehalococcoidia bacterium]|nr:TIGR01777 family oxidoreductase [Dehalococcoidia bacterium]